MPVLGRDRQELIDDLNSTPAYDARIAEQQAQAGTRIRDLVAFGEWLEQSERIFLETLINLPDQVSLTERQLSELADLEIRVEQRQQGQF